MQPQYWKWLAEFHKLWDPPPPEPTRHAHSVLRFLRVIVLPAKMVVLALLLYELFRAGWEPSITRLKPDLLPLLRHLTAYYSAFYAGLSILIWVVPKFPLKNVRWIVFVTGLSDGVFLGFLTFASGGFESPLTWVFVGLIILNALSLPLSALQLVLNLSLSALYLAAGIRNADVIMSNLTTLPEQPLALQNIDTVLLRLAVLWLLTACCYGAQVLAARQRQVEEEAREFAARQGQLRTAGRLAAEIAHQVKNPLAIINNATFSLRRAIANGKTDVSQQLNIIQEEIERSDRIITQLMGYARLAEGRVEKINVTEELDRALDQVFPNAVGYEVEIQRDYASTLPFLVMQRGHLNTVLVNILQNSREALEGKGRLQVIARSTRDQAVEITIQDDGPGIPSEQTERIFEAYYTTKEKGTGLGLAIVKHNVELYGGRIRVESGLGKGARFVLVFPARMLNEPTKTI